MRGDRLACPKCLVLFSEVVGDRECWSCGGPTIPASQLGNPNVPISHTPSPQEIP